MRCICSSRSKCKTSKCVCLKSNEKCTNKCTCLSCLCENHKLDETGGVASNLDLNYITSQIHSQLETSVTRQRSVVLEYRNGVDLYSGDRAFDLIDPHVDHIIETQIISKAAANALRKPLKQNILLSLKGSFNQNYNYNVTHGRINTSKGSSIQAFLKDGYYQDYPLRAVIIGKYCEKYIEPISNAMLDSFADIDDRMRTSRLTDNSITGNGDFSKIADELTAIIAKMDLNNDTAKTLRNKKEYDL